VERRLSGGPQWLHQILDGASRRKVAEEIVEHVRPVICEVLAERGLEAEVELNLRIVVSRGPSPRTVAVTAEVLVEDDDEPESDTAVRGRMIELE
jgi:hypothetical protein